MNKEIEMLYKTIEAKDKIINEQALEIARLKENINYKDAYENIKIAYDMLVDIRNKAIEYIKECMETTRKINDYWTNELVNGVKLLEILGDKE